MLSLLGAAADEHGALLLAPWAGGASWDTVPESACGSDTDSLQQALAGLRRHFPVDPDRVAIAGFGDGASYALGLGLACGDLFTRVLAYSPGRIPPVRRHGRPTVFVSHGRRDTVLPVARTSRLIVPALEADGYHVDYLEHDLGHDVPPAVVAASAELLG
ncbi:alpha/beta hydrolase [Streptomyces sp. NPDC001414]